MAVIAMPFELQPVAIGDRDHHILLSDFILTNTFRPAGLVLKKHYHERTNIGLCIQGSLQETVRGSWQDVTTTTLLCRPAGDPHCNRYGREPVQCVIFEVLPQSVERIRRVTKVLDEPVLLESEVVAAFAARIDAELRTRDSLSPLSIESLVYELIIQAARQTIASGSRRPDWLLSVRDLLHDRFLSDFDLSAVADAVSVNPAHLCRAFRHHFHTTPGEYVRDLRLAHAVTLLKSSMPLAEVSVRCGFYDQSHFSRAFKRRFGVPPARFRKNLSRV